MRTEINIPKKSVVTFSRALASAIYDKRIEDSGQEIYYFHDADVVGHIIRGFKDASAEPLHNGRTLRPLLVTSLASAGFLGHVRILRPHLLEIDSGIRLWAKRKRLRSNKTHREQAREFLTQCNVYQEFKQLSKIVNARKLAKREKIEKIVDHLNEVAPSTFVALELTSMPWDQKLSTLMSGVLRTRSERLPFDRKGEIRRLFKESAFAKLKNWISAERGRMGHNKELSDVRDAAAMTILHLVTRAEQDKRELPQVRFYTETPTLKHAWRKNAEMRELLSYPQTAGNPETELDLFSRASVRAVWRDDTYFLIRAMFEALRFTTPNSRPGYTNSVSLAELEKLSSSLANVPREEPDQVIERVSRLRVGGKSLARTIREIEDLSFVEGVWMNFELTEELRKLLEKYISVWTDLHSEETEELMRREIRQNVETLLKEVEEDTREARAIFDRYSALRRQIGKHLKAVSVDELPDPRRDLGLVRWGFLVSKRSLNDIHNFWQQLFWSEEPEMNSALSQLADTQPVREGGDEMALVYCSLYWALNLFEFVAKTIDELEASDKSEEFEPFRMMRIAARLRCSEHVPGDEVSDLLSEAKSLFEKDHDRFVIGYAYCLFVAWFNAIGSDSLYEGDVSDGLPELERGWIEESFQVAGRAIEHLPKGSLERAFAINHVVFSSAVGNIKVEEGKYWTLRLTHFRTANSWHYRFADTLGYRSLLEGIRAYLAFLEKPPGDRAGREEKEVKSRVCQSLRRASTWLSRSKPNFGDLEILDHRDELDQYLAEVGCESVDDKGTTDS